MGHADIAGQSSFCGKRDLVKGAADTDPDDKRRAGVGPAFCAVSMTNFRTPEIPSAGRSIARRLMFSLPRSLRKKGDRDLVAGDKACRDKGRRVVACVLAS